VAWSCPLVWANRVKILDSSKRRPVAHHKGGKDVPSGTGRPCHTPAWQHKSVHGEIGTS